MRISDWSSDVCSSDLAMSRRIRRMQHIVDAMKVEVEEQVAALFGTTFFLDTPTPARLDKWRAKAQVEAAARAGFAYPPYGHLKLSAIVEELVRLIDRLSPSKRSEEAHV